jgi:benzoylformate decarboxylase
MSTVHEVTWSMLRSLGVTKVFGNPGSTEMPFLANFPADIDYVLGLHESTVVGMADAYAQATGRPALVNVHTAAGLGNAMGALVNAAGAHSPLVVTAGQQVRAMLTLEPFLANPDATTLPRPAVKWAFEPPRAQDLPAALARAFHYAALPPTGPVFVSLPMDDWDQPAELDSARALAQRRISSRAVPDPVALEALAARLAAAQDPVLVVGAGLDAAPGGFQAAIALAERQSLPVWLAPNASRVGFPTDHPYFRGSLPPAISWLSDALVGHDLVLVAGAPIFRYYPYAPGPYLPIGADLVAITDDPDAAARAPIGAALLGDPGLALRRLAELVPQTTPRPAPAPREPVQVPTAPDEMTAGQVHEALGAVFPENGVLVSETMNGEAVMWDRVKFRRPGSFYFASAGGLGFCLPAAVGAQLADPERPVVAISGDGGAQYGLHALYTAAARRIPVTFLIMVNGEYGILKGFGDYLGADGVPGLDVPLLDYEALARGYGVPAARPRTPEELTTALKEAVTATDGPHMVLADIRPGVRLVA